CLQQINAYLIHHEHASQIQHYLGASFGIAAGSQGLGREAKTLDQLINFADQALYQAKHAGRNRIVVI
ncbi:MAG: diguanylate cyclase, partial [Pseudomonadota bacterium]|nr:diguanylate cyclase [Pseudomonadota bacterium]